MNDRDLEQLLARCRPADPASSLDDRIARLTAAPARGEPRVWPWAAAAAALLAITVALHAPAASGNTAGAAVADPLIQQLGGDAVATDVVRLIDAVNPPELPRASAGDFPLERR